MPFVFYDTETTGTSTAFDQILQFAAVYADDDLNEIERFELRCRLLPHVIPSAGAILVTGVSMERLLDPTIPSHHEFICRVHQKLSTWSPAIFVGYNSVRFDEQLLRQAFYQNLQPIYLTNTDGNARQDVLPLIRASNSIAPGVFAIPANADGKPSFKLDATAPANGFRDHDAHDAMGDVLATLHLARLIKTRAPDVWRRSLTFCSRSGVESFINAHDCFYVVETNKNVGTGYFAVPIGTPKHRDRQIICLNLDIDLAAVEAMDDDELGKWTRKSPRPVRRFRTNTAPHLLHLGELPEHVFGEMTARKARTRARRFLENAKLQRRIIKLLSEADEEYEVAESVEEQIYDGFYSKADQRMLERFHAAPWDDRWQIARQFDDKRLKQLARRLVYFERPDVLLPSQQAFMARKMAVRMLGREKSGEWTCIPTAVQELRERWREATGEQRALLKPLKDYLRERRKWAEAALRR